MELHAQVALLNIRLARYQTIELIKLLQKVKMKFVNIVINTTIYLFFNHINLFLIINVELTQQLRYLFSLGELEIQFPPNV